MLTLGIQSYGVGIEDGTSQCAYMLLSGGTPASRDGGVLRDSRGACPVCVDACPRLLGIL